MTSDRHVMPCSFHDLSIPIETADDVIAIWERTARERPPSTLPGCARVPGFGIDTDHSIPVAIGGPR